MNLTDFYKTYPDEEACERALREYRECNTLYCPVCGGLHLSWNPSHRSWTCTDCGHETTLRSGTVMQGSKLPVFDWFVAMFLIAGTKRAISALEVQRQLGRKRYQPVWEMMHKLRDVMGKRDGLCRLFDQVELDEGFFTTETPDSEKGHPLRRGHESQRKTAVPVMAESSVPADMPAKKYSTCKKVGHIRMTVIPDLKAATEEDRIKRTVDAKTEATTDAAGSYSTLVRNNVVAGHETYVMKDKARVGRVLPWVHISISNAKRSILDTYHDVKADFLQLYLNEFCYKFNRRYFGFHLFERLELCAYTNRTSFKHRIY